MALQAGVDVLAHALDDTRGLTTQHLRRMKRQGVALVRTLGLFADNGNLDAEILAEVHDYNRLGGRILFGTDVGYLTDYDPTQEYALLGRVGMNWRDILASLTTHPAARFGEKSRGRIAAGMDADLVVLAADPASDVRAFAAVRHTLRAGKVIYSATR